MNIFNIYTHIMLIYVDTFYVYRITVGLWFQYSHTPKDGAYHTCIYIYVYYTIAVTGSIVTRCTNMYIYCMCKYINI